MNVPRTRYQVSCETCGSLEHFQTKQEALSYARRITNDHTGLITIFDIMAHVGKADLFDADGIAIGEPKTCHW